jgi:aminodeoxyfutalosine deaminase
LYLYIYANKFKNINSISEMSPNKISATHIFDGKEFISDKVILFNEDGLIISIDDEKNHDLGTIQFLEGTLSPGLINTHCHLELSHMKGLIPTGTTLLPFIESVVQNRNFPQEIIDQAIIDGDREMNENGIVAVGDISNQTDTVKVKSLSSIQYYTFVEYFDLMNPSFTSNTIAQYDKVYESHEENDKNKKSKVPHAPYSVTKGLFQYLNTQSQEGSTISIHNEETLAELDLFYHKTGGFLKLFQKFGTDFNEFEATNKSSIHHALKNMNPKNRTLFVHNTLTDLHGLKSANEWSGNVFFASCPNANLYIENRLPNYKIFLDTNQKVTLGTDSLTSNWQLSIWEEMKTILKYANYVPIEELLKWATSNGAEALGFHNLGNIEVGKKPGLVLLPFKIVNDKIIVDQNRKEQKIK